MVATATMDVIAFNPSQLRERHGFYGFNSFLELGKDISIHQASAKTSQNPTGLSIVSSSDTEQLIRLIKKFDIIYHTNYEASAALMTRAAVNRKKLLINLADILDRRGVERARVLHRISQFLAFCISYRAEFIIVSMAKDEFSIRRPQEAADMLASFGLTKEQVRYSYSILSDLIMKKKKQTERE